MDNMNELTIGTEVVFSSESGNPPGQPQTVIGMDVYNGIQFYRITRYGGLFVRSSLSTEINAKPHDEAIDI